MLLIASSESPMPFDEDDAYIVKVIMEDVDWDDEPLTTEKLLDVVSKQYQQRNVKAEPDTIVVPLCTHSSWSNGNHDL